MDTKKRLLSLICGVAFSIASVSNSNAITEENRYTSNDNMNNIDNTNQEKLVTARNFETLIPYHVISDFATDGTITRDFILDLYRPNRLNSFRTLEINTKLGLEEQIFESRIQIFHNPFIDARLEAMIMNETIAQRLTNEYSIHGDKSITDNIDLNIVYSERREFGSELSERKLSINFKYKF